MFANALSGFRQGCSPRTEHLVHAGGTAALQKPVRLGSSNTQGLGTAACDSPGQRLAEGSYVRVVCQCVEVGVERRCDVKSAECRTNCPREHHTAGFERLGASVEQLS